MLVGGSTGLILRQARKLWYPLGLMDPVTSGLDMQEDLVVDEIKINITWLSVL